MSHPATQIKLIPSRRSIPRLSPRERADAQEESDENDGEKEAHVGEKEGAGGEGREVGHEGEVGDDGVEGLGEEMAEGVDHPQENAHAHGHHGGHDLVRGEPGYEEPDGGEGGGQEQEAEE